MKLKHDLNDEPLGRIDQALLAELNAFGPQPPSDVANERAWFSHTALDLLIPILRHGRGDLWLVAAFESCGDRYWPKPAEFAARRRWLRRQANGLVHDHDAFGIGAIGVHLVRPCGTTDLAEKGYNLAIRCIVKSERTRHAQKVRSSINRALTGKCSPYAPWQPDIWPIESMQELKGAIEAVADLHRYEGCPLPEDLSLARKSRTLPSVEIRRALWSTPARERWAFFGAKRNGDAIVPAPANSDP